MLKRLAFFVSFLALSMAAFAQRPAPKSKAPAGKPATKLTGVHLAVDPVFKNYQGACPVRVIFKGDISTNGPATVPYTFEASDGHGYTSHNLTFTAAGRKPVNEAWRITNDFTGWIALKPEAPFNNMSSTRAFFRVKCTGHLKGD